MKYRPDYPDGAFASIEAAQAWVDAFVRWYNEDHQHSGIRFVTPAQRHAGLDVAILENRRQVYAEARARRPSRWTRGTRDWSRIEVVRLNPHMQGSPVAAPAATADQRAPQGAPPSASGGGPTPPPAGPFTPEQKIDQSGGNYLDTHRFLPCHLEGRLVVALCDGVGML
jgi:hypothetical protein